MIPAPSVRVSARQSLRNYLASVAGNHLFLAFSFATSVYLTRALGAAGFGRLALVLAVAQTALLFSEFWTRAAFWRYATEELATAGRLREVFWGRLLVLAPVVGAIGLLGWVVRARIAAFHGAYGIGYGLLLIYVLALFVAQTVQVVYQARSRAGVFAFVQAGERALVLVALVLLDIQAQPALGRILIVYVAASLLTSLVAAARLPRVDIIPVGTSWAAVRRLLAFSFPMIFGVAGSYLTSNWLDIAIIRHWHGSAAVGHYTLAYQLMGAVQQIPMMSFPVVVPLLVGAYVADHNSSIQLYVGRVVPHAVFAMVALLVVGTLIGPALVPMVFGRAFTESARVLPVLLLAVGWYCIYIAYVPLLNVHERTRGLLGASLAAAAANVAGDLALVPVWGIAGAAWATVVAQAVSALVVAGVARRDYRFGLAPVLVTLIPLALVVLGVGGSGSSALSAAGAAVVLLTVTARVQRLGSAPDRRLLASLEIPSLRWILR